MDHSAGLRFTRACLAPDGSQKIHLRSARRAYAGAALSLRQGTPLIHDGPANRDIERIFGLRGDQSILLERNPRAVGNGRSLRQRPRPVDCAVLEKHHHWMGGWEHSILEL